MSTQRYLVTARKYRPQRFDELVAQEHVSDTLKNAIRLDRLAHAYLFSGPRGVGKTTAARILAKAINCQTPLDERPDGSEPCRTCDSCKSFEEGRNLNIIEIDAASNNKVEDVRDLRETVRVPPQGNRKKVYIVDEVHMLSNAAFNALLKTLEEPPPHVLFIFATTEPHKVLPTILSRCQRFDFRRIPVPEIVERLHEICATEEITADEASLLLVARKGDGALRDALSAFDQAVSLCGADLTYAELAQALGVVDIDLFFEVTRHVLDGNSAGMLRLVERIMRSGHDLQEFLVGLAEHLRNLLVARTMDDAGLIEAAEATRHRYLEMGRQFAEPDLLRLLMLVDEAEVALRSTPQPRLKLELALLKMAALTRAADLAQALRKLDDLEKRAAGGEGAAGSGDDISRARSNSSLDPRQQPSSQGASSRAPRVEEPAMGYPKPAAAGGTDPQSARKDAADPRPTAASPPDRQFASPAASPPTRPEPTAASSPTRPEPTAASPQEPPDDSAQGPPEIAAGLFGTPALKKKAAAPDSQSRSATSEITAVQTPEPRDCLGAVERTWPDFVHAVKTERIHVGSLMQHTAPVAAGDESITISVPDEFHHRLLSSQESFLLKHLQEATGMPLSRLQFDVRDNVEPAAPEETAPEFDPYEYMQRKRQENPVIRAIFEQFGGELVW